MKWNHCPESNGIGVQIALEYSYNNPLVTGGEKIEDLDYLFQLTVEIKQLLSEEKYMSDSFGKGEGDTTAHSG